MAVNQWDALVKIVKAIGESPRPVYALLALIVMRRRPLTTVVLAVFLWRHS